MVKIVIENLGKKELPVKDFSASVLHHIHMHFIDWMHACGGKGHCTTCKMIVVSGQEHTSQPTDAELNYRAKGLLAPNERLACQTTVSGDILIRVPQEYKLPHMRYDP